MSWLIAFAMFWYDFIVGDDWTLAVAVALGLAITAVFSSHRVSVWWLIPAIVVTMIGVDLRRASRSKR